MDDNGVSGLEQDELNLENFLLEEEVETKSSYEKTYLKLVSELLDYMEGGKQKEIQVDTVSRVNNQIWSLVDEWSK